jgi:hypothetical protein
MFEGNTDGIVINLGDINTNIDKSSASKGDKFKNRIFKQ